MSSPNITASSEYSQLITSLKQRVQKARIQASRVVNREMILLYWDLERFYSENKTHNFQEVLPSALAHQADEILKDSYSLEFLGLTRTANEQLLGLLKDATQQKENDS